MKRKILVAILTGSLMFTVTACGKQEMGEPQTLLVQENEEEAYPTATAEYGEVVKYISVQCKYMSMEKQELSFPDEGGLIERVEVELGDYVAKGQLLVALDVEDLEEKIEDLEYQVRSQELKLNQTEEMKEFDLASAERLFSYTYKTLQDKRDLKKKQDSIIKQYQTALEDIGDNLTIQRKRLRQYKEELKDGRLYADITGEITYIQEGMKDTYSKKDKVVVIVSNLDACYFISDDITYADCFEEGSSVFVNYMSGNENNTCEVVPVLMENWDEQMYFKPVGEEIIASETNGKITMEYARKENVLRVPAEAVHKSDNGQFVYLEKDGLLEMRYVTVGLEGDTWVEVTDGLEQGEIVALKK